MNGLIMRIVNRVLSPMLVMSTVQDCRITLSDATGRAGAYSMTLTVGK